MAKPKVNRIAQRPLSVGSLYKYNFMILETLEGTQKSSSVCSISARKVRIRPKFYESANILSFIAKPLVNRIAERSSSVDS